jgi:hypothetical protein
MKGQTFMPDFMASILIFGIILTIFLSSWNSVISSQTDDVSMESESVQASHTTSFLVTTPGYPSNWQKSSVDVEIAGFANPDHMLQESKLEEFRDLSYSEQKKLLQAEDYYMTVRNESGIIEMNGAPLEFGTDYSDAAKVVPVKRSVQLNASNKIQEAQLVYVVWSK